MSTLEERSFADSDDSDRFAGTQADTLTSFVKTNAALVKVTAERNALRATLAKVAAIVADPDAALVVDRVRAALGLREQAASETEPVSSPELYPRNSMAVGSESMPNTKFDPTVLYLTAEIAKREDALGIYDDEITRLHALLDAKDATIERVSALAAQWEQEAPTCPCMTCLTNRHHAERIRAALKGSS